MNNKPMLIKFGGGGFYAPYSDNKSYKTASGISFTRFEDLSISQRSHDNAIPFRKLAVAGSLKVTRGCLLVGIQPVFIHFLVKRDTGIE